MWGQCPLCCPESAAQSVPFRAADTNSRSLLWEAAAVTQPEQDLNAGPPHVMIIRLSLVSVRGVPKEEAHEH